MRDRLGEPSRLGTGLRKALVLVAPAVAFTVLWLGGPTSWTSYGIEPVAPSFSDMRSLTTGADCDRRGHDVLDANPCDPYDRPVNYPRMWVTMLRLLGASERHTTALAGVVIAAFAASLLLVARPRSWPEALVWAAALCSPPIMLGAERGNIDLLAFALLAIALWSAGSKRRRGVWLAWGASSVTKLIPAFAGPALFVASDKTGRRRGVVAMSLFVLWCGVTQADLAAINRAVPQGTTVSYGARVAFARWGDGVMRPEHRLWGAALALLLMVSVAALARPLPSSRPDRGGNLVAFRAGVLVYGATFLLGSNWDYRLVFVLFTLPQLFAWSRGAHGALRAGAGVALAAVLAVLWLGHGGAANQVADDVASWGLLLCLVALAHHTFPIDGLDPPPRVHRSRRRDEVGAALATASPRT